MPTEIAIFLLDYTQAIASDSNVESDGKMRKRKTGSKGNEETVLRAPRTNKEQSNVVRPYWRLASTA